MLDARLTPGIFFFAKVLENTKQSAVLSNKTKFPIGKYFSAKTSVYYSICEK